MRLAPGGLCDSLSGGAFMSVSARSMPCLDSLSRGTLPPSLAASYRLSLDGELSRSSSMRRYFEGRVYNHRASRRQQPPMRGADSEASQEVGRNARLPRLLVTSDSRAGCH